MWLPDIYNHQHKFAQLSLLSRNMYWLPAFAVTMFANQLIFHALMIGLYLGLIRMVCNIKTVTIFHLIKYPLLFVAVGCSMFLVSLQSTNPWFSIGSLSIGLDSMGIEMTLLVFCRSFTMISMVYFALLINTISEIAEMMKAIKLPSVFIELFVTTYKFIENLLQSSEQMYLAQKCRLAYSGGGNTLNSFSMLLAAVFQRALTQAKQLEISMESRGSNGTYSFIRKEIPFEYSQLVRPVILSAFIIVSFIITKQYGF